MTKETGNPASLHSKGDEVVLSGDAPQNALNKDVRVTVELVHFNESWIYNVKTLEPLEGGVIHGNWTVKERYLSEG